MKKNLKLIWNILQVIILVYVFFITFLVVNINEFGFSEVGKSTYVPVTKKVKKYLNYKTGDLLIIKNTEINKNDNIYYYTVVDSEYYIAKTKVLEVNKDIYTTED